MVLETIDNPDISINSLGTVEVKDSGFYGPFDPKKELSSFDLEEMTRGLEDQRAAHSWFELVSDIDNIHFLFPQTIDALKVSPEEWENVLNSFDFKETDEDWKYQQYFRIMSQLVRYDPGKREEIINRAGGKGEFAKLCSLMGRGKAYDALVTAYYGYFIFPERQEEIKTELEDEIRSKIKALSEECLEGDQHQTYILANLKIIFPDMFRDLSSKSPLKWDKLREGLDRAVTNFSFRMSIFSSALQNLTILAAEKAWVDEEGLHYEMGKPKVDLQKAANLQMPEERSF